jgi:hypothetical protein
VVLEGVFYPKAAETGWSSLGNRTIRFGGHCELVLAPLLVSVFTSESLFYPAATNSGFISALGFALPSAEDSLLGLILPRLLSD